MAVHVGCGFHVVLRSSEGRLLDRAWGCMKKALRTGHECGFDDDSIAALT